MDNTGFFSWLVLLMLRPNYSPPRRNRHLVPMHNAANEDFCQTWCNFEDTYIVLNGKNLNSIIMFSDYTGNYPDYFDVITFFQEIHFAT